MRTREEHLAWCKQNALEYCNQGLLADAVASMAGDMRGHPETPINDTLLMLGVLYVNEQDADGVRRWIEGFR